MILGVPSSLCIEGSGINPNLCDLLFRVFEEILNRLLIFRNLESLLLLQL